MYEKVCSCGKQFATYSKDQDKCLDCTKLQIKVKNIKVDVKTLASIIIPYIIKDYKWEQR